MTLKNLGLILLIASAPLFACIDYYTGIKTVYYRGAHELGGALTFIARSDGLSEASPANPIYISFTLTRQVSFADTLVLQNSPKPSLASPINLPLRLEGQAGVTMVAAADAVRIVRWVAGEDTVWIEVRQSSSLWLNHNGSLGGPDADNIVTFDLGLSARASDQLNQLGVNANLPFATRNALASEGSFAEALSVLNCMDLRNSELAPQEYTEAEIYHYHSDANQGGGVFAPGTHLDCIIFFPGHILGVGRDHTCQQSEAQLQPAQILAGPASMARIRQAIAAFQSCPTVPNNLPTTWAEGSSVHLSASGSNAGFETHPNVSFAQWAGTAVVRPESAFQHNGLTLYRELDLYYLGPEQVIDHNLELDVELLYAPTGTAQPQLNLETVVLPFASASDSSPYTLPSQHLRCPPEAYVLANQSVNLGVATIPTLGEAAQFILVLALFALAIIHLRRNPQA